MFHGFELVYLDPITNLVINETNEDYVHYSSGGVLLELGDTGATFIPWHRVNAIHSSRASLHQLMSLMAFPE